MADQTDVAALAAALRSETSAIDPEPAAEAIIAALAAAGWRMYRNPTVSEMSEGMEDYDEAASDWLDNLASEAERQHAAVRAALEGLRAEVDALPGMAIASSTDSQRLQAWVNRPALLAIIDARLAALDA